MELGLLRDCNIFAYLRITFVSSSSTHRVFYIWNGWDTINNSSGGLVAGSRYGWDITINCLNSLTAGLRIETRGNYLLCLILIQPVKTINNIQPLIRCSLCSLKAKKILTFWNPPRTAVECWSKFWDAPSSQYGEDITLLHCTDFLLEQCNGSKKVLHCCKVGNIAVPNWWLKL